MLEEPTDNHQNHEIEEAPSQRRERSAKKPREAKKREPEKVYLLITSPNSHEVVEEADLAAAGARVVADGKLKLYEGTLMEPKIAF